ncbi:hypothetical protein R9C00_13960 [Flammeovirgaceae bacterium SG7u.111]|nr:hypothetical protein [Flammeovirgaceae bacterium SG7u.132]WPO38561.1 hypothetical protein R9C00_13960 [Flammeovirgaceae bacterium SG7u.111]
MAKSNKKDSDKPKVHNDLNGFDIKINEFGEIESTFPIDKLNQFLNKKVVDKKLKDRLGYKSDEDDDTIDFMYDNKDE